MMNIAVPTFCIVAVVTGLKTSLTYHNCSFFYFILSSIFSGILCIFQALSG